MQPISNLIPSEARTSAPIAGVKKLSKISKPEDEAQGHSAKPVIDEYVPEEKQNPSGRYWLVQNEDGKPKIYFDNPERTENGSEKPEEHPNADVPEQDRGSKNPEKKSIDSKKAEICRGSTDKVDREIENLKKKKEELKRKINSETDEMKIKELERKLAKVENELNHV